MVFRRFRFDLRVEVDRRAMLVRQRLAPSVSEQEQKRGLLQMTMWIAAIVGLFSVYRAVATKRMLPRFDERSVTGWMFGIENGTIEERMRAVHDLRTTPLLLEVPCDRLMVLVSEDAELRRIAVPTIAEAVRGQHCVQTLLELLDTASSDDARRSALAALALAAIRDSSAEVLQVLERVFDTNTGDTRAYAMEALIRLQPSCRRVQLVQCAMADTGATVRQSALRAMDEISQCGARDCGARRASRAK